VGGKALSRDTPRWTVLFRSAPAKNTLLIRAFEGGAEWGGPAVDPDTDVLYINANNYASMGALAFSNFGSPGRMTYLNQCGICHGEHRQGSNEFPPLLNIGHKLTVEQIAAAIHDGKGRMPAMPLQGNTLKGIARLFSH